MHNTKAFFSAMPCRQPYWCGGEEMSSQWKVRSIKVIFFVLLLALSGPAIAQELTIYVDNWPPYNFNENNKIVGISTELVEAALEDTNIKYDITMLPFKRALYTVQNTPNTMLFTVARIPQRDDMFAWIGPLHTRRLCLYKLKKRSDIQIQKIEDIQKYHIGALLGGSVEQFFIANGFSTDNYLLVNSSDHLLKILFNKRVDLIPGDPIDLAYQVKNSANDFSELEIAYFLSEEGGYYMAANKDTPHEIIEEIQTSLDTVLATGLKERLIKKYMDYVGSGDPFEYDLQ